MQLVLMTQLLFVLAVPGLGAPSNCSTDMDCSLNGLCLEGKCVCDAGWRAEDCGELDLQPTDRNSGYNLTGEGVSSWGSRITQDPEDERLFHLFVSEFTSGCGLEYWTPFSRIIRAESRNGPLGPYKFAEEVVGAFAHNPTVMFDGKRQQYVLYFIGCPVTLPQNCSQMNFTCGKGNDANGESGISIATSPNAKTWTIHGEVFSTGGAETWDEDVTNPSAFVLESASDDVSILLAYRGCPYNCSGPELISLASVDDPKGPYTRIGPGPIFSAENEDPFLWKDKRGNYHMLLHSLEPDGGFGSGPKVGRHAFARSWEGPWTFNNETLAFNTTVFFTDGTAIEYNRRERPQLFFSSDDQMTPLYMTNGVQEKGTQGSYTVIVPIGSKYKKSNNA